jgi:hypothetical protein
MAEYIFKFLPAFTDGGLKAVFDGFLLGDPRVRILSNLLGYVEIALRRFLLLRMSIPPTVGISWLLYPATIALFGWGVAAWRGSRRCGAMAAVLIASSPALLDFLCNHYIPAKPLAMFCFAGGLWCAARAASTDAAHFVLWASGYFGFLLAGLLSDETAILVGICVPILMLVGIPLRRFFREPMGVGLAAISGLTIVLYTSIVILAIPAINRALGQHPVHLLQVAHSGVYEALYAASPVPISELIARYAPISLMQIIVETHLFPLRETNYIWTSAIFQGWRWWEWLMMLLFAIIFACFVRNAGAFVRRFLIFSGVSLMAYVIIEAFILIRLAPYIVETNYYGDFASFFVAIIFSVLLSSWIAVAPSLHRRVIGWGLVAMIATIQFSNYVGTASRHPMFYHVPEVVTWQSLRQANAMAREGQFAEFAAKAPYPNRLFVWGLETAIARSHAQDENVDLCPFGGNPDSPMARLDLDSIADPAVPLLDISTFHTAADLLVHSAVSLPLSLVSEALGSGKMILGRSGDWNFLWILGGDERLQQIAWRKGIMRAWYDEGALTIKPESLCLAMRHAPFVCATRFYACNGFVAAVDEGGEIKAYFLLNVGIN